MARAATVQALRNRGISKKTAETLADAGFTLEVLGRSKVERLKKFIAEKEAVKVLKKVGGPAPAPEVAKKPKARPPARRKAIVSAAGPEAEPEAPLKLPTKAPGPSAGEQEVYDGLKEIGHYLPRFVVKELARKMEGIKLTKKRLHEVLERVCAKYEIHVIDPNESAGIVSAQSIGEPGTQMSLPYDQKVIVKERGLVRVVPIGEIVDDLMCHLTVSREGTSEWCDLPAREALAVLSLTAEAKAVWKPVRSVSRHLPKGSLLRLLTRTGREITATGNHSFVTRRDGRIVPVSGRALRRGDRIPIVRRWTAEGSRAELDLGEYLRKEEYWFGSEVAKARAMGSGWRRGVGRDFVVPVGPEALGRHLRGEAQFSVEPGFVYPRQNHSRSHVPESMPLDGDLGWLVGAYLAEGWAAHYYVNISNTDERFLRRTRKIADGLRIHYAEMDNFRGFARGHDIHLRSTVLSAFLRATCGSLSDAKRVPDFAFGAPDAFVTSLLRAYFDGDGNVTVARGAIRASSDSKELMDGIGLLLARLGILASRGRRGQHTVWIPRRYARTFQESIGFESVEKRLLLDRLCDEPARGYTLDSLDMVSGFGSILKDVARKLGIPTRRVNSFTRRQRIGRETLRRYTAEFEARARSGEQNIDPELRRLRTLLDEDVTWDEILEIREVAASPGSVYDFSVPGVETFTTAEGVVTHNTMRTFHYAGVAEMNVTLGLPRLIEIVDARRVPSTPIMEIHVKSGHTDLEKMRKIATEIEVTTVDDVAEIETDLEHMRVLAFPDDHRMKSRGVTWSELEERMKKVGTVEEVRRTVGTSEKKARALVVEAGEPSYKKLQRLVEQLRVTKIKGIDGISRAIIKKRGDGYVIYTEGSNLSKILEMPYVDGRRTTTNSVQEIYEVLGIEAARNAIVNEAYNTLQEQGLTVDIRHIMLVSDMMTNDGDVKAIGRHGISGRKSSVLARAAFEITAHHLLRAAIQGEVDYLDGVAENVIVGQPVTLGTGAVNLVYKPPARLPKPKAPAKPEATSAAEEVVA
ncbi:MAG TPA: DNA-directed RNA polymerase subunit A'' [Thermoplasmata archaeon]|nr:DNA-directed RNA polymerase subunit A'' [Thermoplasmata archaeon]